MLTKEIENEIVQAVHKRPMAISELAQILEINWRTADRYVSKIVKETGLIDIHVFRKGSQGALKVVYAKTVLESQSSYQKYLLNKILQGRSKEDFSALDVVQFCEKKELYSSKTDPPKNTSFYFWDISKSVNDEILVFSGNMSWLTDDLIDSLKHMISNGCVIKILTKVDITSTEKLSKLLDLNKTVSNDKLFIRHCAQPVRGIIVDSKKCYLKEIFDKASYNELSETKYVFTNFTDPEWVSFMRETFLQLWHSSIDADKRITLLDEIN